jgi:pilus assembly protein TadC
LAAVRLAALRMPAMADRPVSLGRVVAWVRLLLTRRRDRAIALAAAIGTAGAPPVVAGRPGVVAGLVLCVPAFFCCRLLLRRAPPRARPDPLLLASTWDLLAACLRGGLPVPAAVRAVAVGLPGEPGEALRRAAELLALGADPVAAWEQALRDPATAELARAARRSARSGTALAAVADGMATAARAAATEWSETRVQRAAVVVAGPLGLCFLPAFLCVGVAPVVIGLASRLTTTW